MRNFTKFSSLLLLFLLSLGVSHAWGGKRRVYFDYSLISWWENDGAITKAHVWNDSGSGDYLMTSVVGQPSLLCCDIDDSYVYICFNRKSSDDKTDHGWTSTWTIGSNNKFKVKDYWGTEGDDKGKICKADTDNALRWTPSPAIDGLIDLNNPHNQAFDFEGDENEGTYEVTLSAHTTYQFKILDGTTAYGLDNNVWTSSISNYTLNTTGYYLRLCTAGEGTYTFTYDKSKHEISVAYPTVIHPNIDYCYLKDYTATDWSKGVYIHFKDASTSASIAGTTWCGTQIHNKVEIGTGQYYFYYSPGDYPYFNLNEQGDGTDQTNDRSAVWGKFLAYNSCTASAWDWCPFTVHIGLNDLGANTNVNPSYFDVAFNVMWPQKVGRISKLFDLILKVSSILYRAHFQS